MISKAVIYLNNAPVSDLELFYSYMGKKSSFEFHLELLFRLLSHVTNREILDSLETRMEKTINRKDPLFAFSRESGLSIYLEYLFEMKPVKFEELALEFIDSISGVKMKYAEHLFLNKRYAEVIDLLKKEIPHHLYNAIYEGSLLVLKRYDELIQFYSDCNSRLFSLSLFKKAVQLARHHVPEILGKLITEALANKIKTFEETIELYLFLDKGDEAVRIMEQLTEEQFQYFRDYIDKLTAKLMIINPAVAVKFAETLVNKEFAVVNRTNYYDRLIDYIHNLEMLEDRDFLNELYHRIKTQYKTKKKLLERLNLTALQIEEQEIDLISRNSNIKGPELKLIKFKK